QGTDGQMNGHAARKQADGEKHWNVKHLLWGRSTEALAHIKEVGDNKDGEDGRLGDNETIHPHSPTRGRSPSEFRFERCNCGYTHRNLPLLILPIWIFRVFEVPEWTATLHGWSHGEVICRRW